MKNIFLTFFLVWLALPLFSQKSLVKFAYPQLRTGLDNVFLVVAQQNMPIQLNQVKVTFQAWEKELIELEVKEGNASFSIKPQNYGQVKIYVKLADTTEVHDFYVSPIKAKGLLSYLSPSNKPSFSDSTFKKLSGIIAKADCINCCMTCRVISFEVIRISKDNNVEKTVSQGAKFKGETKKMIEKAISGDIYIFRKIEYKCPQPEIIQYLEDMTVDIL